MHKEQHSFSIYEPEMMPTLLELWNAATAGTLPLSPKLWQQNVDRSGFFRPEDCIISTAGDGSVTGFVLTRILSETEIEANPDMADYRGRGHIMALAVHPRHQRQGTGSALLQWAEADLRSRGANTIGRTRVVCKRGRPLPHFPFRPR